MRTNLIYGATLVVGTKSACILMLRGLDTDHVHLQISPPSVLQLSDIYVSFKCL